MINKVKNDGFSIIEILVSLSLIAISFYIYTAAISQGTKKTKEYADRLQIALLARSIIDEHTQDNLSLKQLNGEHENARWQLLIDRVNTSKTAQLFRVRLKISIGEISENFVTFRLQKIKL